MPSAQLKQVYKAAQTQGLSISEFVRSVLQAALAPPINLQLPSDPTDEPIEQKNLCPRTRLSQNEKRCLHDLPKHQCSTCNALGL